MVHGDKGKLRVERTKLRAGEKSGSWKGLGEAATSRATGSDEWLGRQGCSGGRGGIGTRQLPRVSWNTRSAIGCGVVVRGGELEVKGSAGSVCPLGFENLELEDGSSDRDDLVIKFEEFTSTLLPGRDVCGKQDEQQRIYGGEQVGIGEFPWLVLLESSEYGFVCGGALINTRYVLTAAHCLTDTIDVVRLGEHNVKTAEDCEGDTPGLGYCSDPPVDVEIEEIINHKSFVHDDHKLYADIALLRLKKEVRYTDFIKPICLPLSSEIRSKALSGNKVTVAGWGITLKTLYNDEKLKLEVTTISNHECDSGGPLLYRDRQENKENWVTIGIVSFGLEKCAVEDVPGVYTRVTEYLQWILDNIKP
ncbi:hypothetical protein ILUMI_24176 [Ignelater luminosus]|uniref:Peptidase S1 domain-containing protein n=1 Tax=Ignelater luminosus TaxID=2038154 RepID=A0A8K0CDY2_IGNLU|nr:hypothetical protein ILUMI_24176 [Ignelater luminosus]